MRCKVCGKEIKDDAKFCKYCGSLIKDNSPKKKKSKTIPFLIISSVLAITLLSVTGIYLWKENKSEPEEFKEEATEEVDEKQDDILENYEDEEYEESYSRIEKIKQSYNAGTIDYAEVKNQINTIEQELDSQEQIEAKQLKVLVETDLANNMQVLAKEKQYQKIVDELNNQSNKLNSQDTVVEDLLDTYTKEYQELAESEKEDDTQKTAATDIEKYIIPDSDSRYLTEDEVKKLSLKEINYAKNEIYARHGRKFDSQELQNYFNSKSWYHGTIEPANFQNSLLNNYEQKNAELLSKVEYSISSEGYKLDAN